MGPMSPSPEVMPFPGGSLPQEVREGPAPCLKGVGLRCIHSRAPLLCLGPLPQPMRGAPRTPCVLIAVSWSPPTSCSWAVVSHGRADMKRVRYGEGGAGSRGAKGTRPGGAR